VTYEDTQVVSGGKPIWSYMRTALQTGIMPLPPVQIDSADLDTLMLWLDAGAPASKTSDTCSGPAVGPPEGGIDAESDPPNSSAGDADGDARSDDACSEETLDSLDADGALRSSADEADGDAGRASLDGCALDDGGTGCD
jgi:hypothetical protein